MTKISVLMPCKTLNEKCKKAIDSILNQTYKSLELIITIDGGKNNLEINDSRVEIYHLEENKGPGSAINNCYKYSKGEYITVHDDDDFSELNRFEILMQKIQKRNVITSFLNHIKNDNLIIKNFHPTNFIFENSIKAPAHHCATLMKRALWNKIGSYNENYIVTADSLRMIKLGIYLLLKKEDFSITNIPLYNYVRNKKSDSISTTKQNLRKQLMNKARTKILNFYKENPNISPDEFLKWFDENV